MYFFQVLTRWREPLLGLVLDSTFDKLATVVHRFHLVWPLCKGLGQSGLIWCNINQSSVMQRLLEKRQHLSCCTTIPWARLSLLGYHLCICLLFIAYPVKPGCWRARATACKSYSPPSCLSLSSSNFLTSSLPQMLS